MQAWRPERPRAGAARLGRDPDAGNSLTVTAEPALGGLLWRVEPEATFV